MSGPRLTVNILTRDSEERLKGLLFEVSNYADEVLVGVDAASSDGTLEIASEHADRVYRFSHSGQLAPARMLPFEYASGDWILSIDDDESLEPSFDALVPQLLSEARVTHYWFPRKWIVSMDPCERLDGPHWFPDWQLRLFRNDRTLVWKPSRPHSGYCVQGLGCYEERASILHFEPLLCSSEARERKRKLYLEMGADARADGHYSYDAHTPRVKADLRAPSIAPERAAQCIVHKAVHRLTTVPAPWHSEILSVDMREVVRATQWFAVEVRARNSGRVAWTPFCGGRCAQIQLGFHLLREDGELIQWDMPRCPVMKFVPPGEIATFLYGVEAPATAGRYWLEWDLVSEGDCWFADCGASVLRTSLEVIDRPS